jgi:hypothetical protein
VRPSQGDAHAGDGDVIVLCDSESSSPSKKKVKREDDEREAKEEEEEEKDLVTYVADEDETPRSIGKKLGVPASEVVRLNLDSFPRLSQSSQFKHGTSLKVPKEGSNLASEAQEPPPSSSKLRHREDDEDEEGDSDDGGPVPDTAEAKAVAEAMRQYVEIPGRLRVSDKFLSFIFTACFRLALRACARHSFCVRAHLQSLSSIFTVYSTGCARARHSSCVRDAHLQSPGLCDTFATLQTDLGKLPLVPRVFPSRCPRSTALPWGSCRTVPAVELCSSKQ